MKMCDNAGLNGSRWLIPCCFTILLSMAAGFADDKAKEKDSSPAVAEAKQTDFEQPQNLAELLDLKPEQIERVDIARIDLLCAEGLRGSENLNVQSSLDRLDAWALHV